MFSKGVYYKHDFAFPSDHFHHAEDCLAGKGSRVTRLVKSLIEQILVKESQILAKPFKIQTVCSRSSKVVSAVLQQADIRQNQGHYVHIRKPEFHPVL